MAETNCLQHPDRPAEGHCAACGNPGCSECLDAATSLCPDCRSGKPQPKAPPAAPAPGPFRFKGMGLDDDPLGLFGGKPSAPKLDPPAAPPPAPAPPAQPGPAPSPSPSPAAPPARPATPLPEAGVVEKGAASGKPSFDLDSLIREPVPLRPPFPKAESAAAPGPAAPASPAAPAQPAKESPAARGRKAFFRLKSGAQKAARPVSGALHPVAKRLKVPVPLLAGLLLLALVLAGVGIGAVLSRPTVATVDSIVPLHMVQVTAGQISELDITAYTDLESRLQSMGFAPVIQMTVPQLPSPNFFDVGMKEDAGVYSEILKVPGQIAPRLSFVTVFADGMWLSTNGWKGTGQSLDYLDSGFYPNDTPDQLYVRHIQRVKALESGKGLQVETLSESRYMAALSDHLRWFLDLKGLQPYQARFSLWN